MNKKTTRILTKASPAKKAAKTGQLEVAVDYPQQDEGITSAEYTFRIGTTPQADKVEVSIDRGPWLTCRSAEGFWWYDWTKLAPGVHRLTARAMNASGETGISVQRRFQVLG